jgi:hypothetical protein
VRIQRKGNRLTKIIAPTFHLELSRKKEPELVSVFETKNAALSQRIETAINRVAAAFGAKKEI